MTVAIRAVGTGHGAEGKRRRRPGWGGRGRSRRPTRSSRRWPCATRPRPVWRSVASARAKAAA